MSIKSFIFSTAMKIKPKMPTVLVVAGTAVGITAATLAVKKGIKLHTIIEEDKATMKRIDEAEQNPNAKYVVEQGDTDDEPTVLDYDHEAAEGDRKEIVKHMTAETIRAYALPVGLGLLAITMIFAGYRMKCKALVAMTASYNSAIAALKTYRKRIADKYGVDVERDLYLGRDTEIRESVDEEGNVSVEQVETVKPCAESLVLRFDSSCTEWRNDAMYLRSVINMQKRNAQQLYSSRSTNHLYLSELTDGFGAPRDLNHAGKGWSEKLNDEEACIKINFAGNSYINNEDGECVAYIPLDIDGFIAG